MQITTLESTKITAPRQRRGLGERDLWELWLLDEAEDVPCGSILTFLNYLCSEGTKRCEIHKATPLATGSVDIRLRGPVADDERNHLLRYRLTRGNVGRLGKAEKDLLVSGLMKHCPPTQGNELNQKVRQAPIERYAEVLEWLWEIHASASPDVALAVVSVIPPFPVPGGDDGFKFFLGGVALSASRDEALEALAPLAESPVLGDALVVQHAQPTTFAERLEFGGAIHSHTVTALFGRYSGFYRYRQ